MPKLIFVACLLSIFVQSCKTIASQPSDSKGEKTFNDYVQRIANEWQYQAAPNFDIQTTDNQRIKLKDYAGKIVILNFWFMNCPPCVTEIASLNELHRQYKNKGVVVLAIATDKTSELASFIKSKNIEYLTAGDGKNIAQSYKVNTYPTTYLIDKQGIIQKVFTGASDWDATYTYTEIKPYLEKILNQ